MLPKALKTLETLIFFLSVCEEFLKPSKKPTCPLIDHYVCNKVPPNHIFTLKFKN